MFENFKDELFKKALESGFTDCEILYNKSNSFSVSIFEGEINQFKNAQSNGVSFRGTFNGIMGYSYTENVQNSEIDLLIENAKVNATLVDDSEKEELFFTTEKYKEVNSFYPKIEEATVDFKIALAKDIEKKALAYNDKITKVETTVVANSLAESFIANTKGLNLYEKSNLCYAYIQTVAEEGEFKKVGFDKWIGTDFDDLDAEKLSKGACDRAINSLYAKPINSAKLPVVFENESFTDLLSCFAHSFFAENVQRGYSKLKGKLNEKIGNENITFRDDSFLDVALINSSFDSEGVPCYNKVVVENGVLKTFLYNTKTAKKDNVASTGNGYRGGIKSSLGTATTNFYLVPSDNDNLLDGIEKGILITELSGLHAGVNSISGDFSLLFGGYLIENGVKTDAIEQMTVAGNFFTMLFDVEKVGSDLTFDFPDGMGAMGSPSVLVNNLTVSGL